MKLKYLYLDSADDEETKEEKEQSSAEYYHKMWSWFDRFNADSSSKSKTFQNHFARSKDWVIPEDQRSALHENHEKLLDFYAAAGTAMLNEYSGKSAFAVFARRYEWMRSLFSTAKNQLAEFLKKKDYDQATELVKLLGEDALIEIADWLIQTRDR